MADSNNVNDLEKKINELQNEVELYETGVYSYKYQFQDIKKYDDSLKLVKEAQKVLIKENKAFSCSVKDLKSSPIIKNLEKLALFAFNSSCDTIIDKVKYNNYSSCEEKIQKNFHKINTFLSTFNCELNTEFYHSKVKELAIGLEWEEEKQRIKQEQDDIKAQMREEMKAIAEAEKKRDKAIEEEERAEEALALARKELEGKAEAERAEYETKILELEAALAQAQEESERATSNAQITSVGHVYIISNIGSFGEGILKIGMTRRDDPMDRVKELGDASVPFTFDVHAMVFSENARKLESDLHSVFEDKRVNKVNKRKEFFHVSLDEVQKACKDQGLELKLTRLAEARDYRESIKIVEEDEAA